MLQVPTFHIVLKTNELIESIYWSFVLSTLKLYVYSYFTHHTTTTTTCFNCLLYETHQFDVRSCKLLFISGQFIEFIDVVVGLSIISCCRWHQAHCVTPATCVHSSAILSDLIVKQYGSVWSVLKRRCGI